MLPFAPRTPTKPSFLSALGMPLCAALLAVVATTDASAMPSAPFHDDFQGWSFDPNTPWTPPEPVDPGGGGGLPPLYATTPQLLGRAHDQVTLSFLATADDAVGIALERSVGRDGKFDAVQCWNTTAKTDTVKTDTAKTDTMQKRGTDEKGAAERDVSSKRGGADVADYGCRDGAPPASYVDAGLARDTLYCWRTRVWDAAGASVASPARCGYTRGFSGADDDPARTPWRARLVVETGDVSDAGTDDDVRIGLNDHWNNTTPHGNATWLDYRHDDFERGAQFVYDLDLATLEDVHDITLLSVFKDGDDGWCVSRLALEIDRGVVFEQDFSSEPDGCRWIGDDEALTFDHDALRASPDWQDFVPGGPGLTLEGADITSRIESAVGNLAHHTELYWDGSDDGVWLSRVSDQTFHVEIETTASVDDWDDPTVRIDFDVAVEIGCTPNGSGFDVAIDFVPRNARVSAEGVLFEVGEFFACGISGEWNCIEEAMNDGLLAGLPTFGGASLELPLCPTTTIDEFGSVSFGF